MKYYYILISLFTLIIFNGCQEDFLDRTPLDQVTSVAFFKQTNDLKTYLNQFYNDDLFPIYNRYGNDFGTDNTIARNPDHRLDGTLTVSTTGTLPFTNVRRINFFFDNYRKVEENAAFGAYVQYLGEAYFFKALIYYNLLRTYGDIHWLTTGLGTKSPELYKPRDPRNVVADSIIAALDTAAMYLQAGKTDGASRINKWMALLLQSRIALYEGSWEKYHSGDPFGVTDPQPEKYFNKAAEAAQAVMESGLYDIHSTGKPASDYYDLFSVIKDFSANKEVLFWQKLDHDGIGYIDSPSNQRNYRMVTPIGNSFTKELADSYLCTDGKPVTGNPLFMGYSSLLNEMQNRDPRFRQTFAPPDGVWRIHENGTKDFWTTVYYQKLNTGSDYDCPGGYIIQKGYDPDMSNHVYENEENPSIIYRYAEVLLNFAEAKAELGTLTQADADRSVNKLRARVGMPALNLSLIASDPKWDFPSLSPMLNEIRRERRVELAAEGFRWDDIARWAAADELIAGKRPRGFKASQIVTKNPFPVGADGFLDPYRNAVPNGYGFVLGRDYLSSIPESEIVINPNLAQNPGW